MGLQHLKFIPHTSSHTRQIVGSRKAALETLIVLRQVVSKARFSDIEQLVEIIHNAGRRLVEAQPKGKSLAPCRPIATTWIIQNSLSEIPSGRFCITSAKSTEQPRRRHPRIPPSQSLNSCTRVNLVGGVWLKNQRRMWI